ncbi:hypothetical protein Tco_1189785 [Tanacetum coccineum]
MVLRIVSKSLTLFVITKSDASKENYDDSLVKEQVSEDTSSFVESLLNVDKETIFLVDKKIEFAKPKNHEKPVKKLVRYAEMYRSQSPRGNLLGIQELLQDNAAEGLNTASSNS